MGILSCRESTEENQVSQDQKPIVPSPNIASKFLSFFVSLAICFAVVELVYRLFDPFPYFSPAEINNTEFGNLSQYDAQLGWAGIPNSSGYFVTEDNKVWIKNNSQGNRDIEHNALDPRPAIVIVGDSFAWGFEVEFNDMFVNRLRQKFPNYEIYNLSHRGYGTDQMLLALKNMQIKKRVALVIVMFYENDFFENVSTSIYGKDKPKFVINPSDNQLILTNVPVPKSDGWYRAPKAKSKSISFLSWLKELLLRSHFIHDVYFRIGRFNEKKKTAKPVTVKDAIERVKVQKNVAKDAVIITGRLLEEFKAEAAKRGGNLAVIAIPSKIEFEPGYHGHDIPYQTIVEKLCSMLKINYLDLSLPLHRTWRRIYYRLGIHWNPYGHQKAADAITDYLRKNKLLESPSA